MAAPARRYNPGFLTDEELVASFCVRKTEFEMLVEALRACTGASNPHQIVIGPRGSGKTSLLLRVAAEARRDAALAACCLPVVFAEESYEVATAGEFWLECLTHLAAQAPYRKGDPDLDRTVSELRAVRDDRVLADRCLGALLDFADRCGRRLLLLVENLNMLFGDMADRKAGWRLRKVLQTEPRIILFASATSRFDEIDHPDRALYDLFRVRTLRPLDTEQCAVLWESVAGRPAARNTVRALEILTGGSPRLIAIVARFGTGRSFRELMADLLDLVDDHTEYFKSHLEALPAQERRVYLALAALWKPATTREIADRARLEPSPCSAQLARLRERGAVQEAGGSTRRKQYYLTERLYNIYYLLRRRSEPDRLVEALVRFMEAYYSPRELMDISASMVSEMDHLNGEAQALCRTALVRLMESPVLAGDRAQPEQLLAACSELALRLEESEAPTAREWVAMAFVNKGVALVRLNRSQEALSVWDEVERRFSASNSPVVAGQVARAIVNKAIILRELGRYSDAAAACDDVVHRFRASPTPALLEQAATALFNKGLAFVELKRRDDALAAYDEAVRLVRAEETPAFQEILAVALIGKGGTLVELRRLEDALAVGDEVVHRFGASRAPNLQAAVATALVIQGAAFNNLRRPEDALAACDEVVRRFATSLEPHLVETVASALEWKVYVELGRRQFKVAMAFADQLLDHCGTELTERRCRGHLIRAKAALAQGDRSTCARDLGMVLELLPELDSLPPGVLKFLLDFSIALGLERMHMLIGESPSAALLQPLLAALEQELGLESRVAQEVEEVARDIRKMLLCRQAVRKYDAATAQRLHESLADVRDADRLAEISGLIVECETAADLLACVSGARRAQEPQP